MRRFVALALPVALGAAVAGAAAPPEPDPLAPAATGGLAAVDAALAKLATHRRLLIVGAHPDDEDTALLAWVAQGLGGEAAYLSLSRGEGGQNLIGEELGVGLGLLRSEELLAARRVDGARQFFTRAFDFGYKRSLEETLAAWPRAELERDALRIVRRFKPQVLVSVFPADERAGHGQHQAAGLLAEAVWRLARDPAALPELGREEGLPPWAPQAFYRSAWSRPEEATLTLSLSALEPVSGRSVVQLAAASRSLHRSQDMGRTQPLGAAERPLAWVAGGAGPASDDPFAGIDTRLAAIAALLPAGEGREATKELLDAVEERARAARAALSPVALDAAVPSLAAIVAELAQAQRLAAGEPAASGLISEKLDAAQRGLAAAAGIAVEARADRERLVAGGPLGVTVEVWNAGSRPVRLRGVALEGPAAAPSPHRLEIPDATLDAGELATFEASWTVPALEPTTPYFLRRPLTGGLYDWSGVEPAQRGEPFEPPLLEAVVDLEIEGAEARLRREVVEVTADQALGEVRRPLRVVPAVEVAVEPALVLWPLAGGAPRELVATVTSNLERPVGGHIEVRLGDGRTDLAPIPFEIPAGRGQVVVPIALEMPAGSAAGTFEAEVRVVPREGPSSDHAYPSIDYPHVRPRPRPQAARSRVELLDLALPRLERLAYVRGASDRVPEVLRQLGLPLEIVDGARLEREDLGGYDAIVVGSRAYETDLALERANARLLDYVRAGGLAIVQYQQYSWVEGGFAPLGITIARPHGRVTDESSSVRSLAPDHPVFARPNPIGPSDWKGWVQERGLYFAASWEEPARPLLALQDPGQPEQLGSLLVAPLGEGTYVYTGLAFFRQLPAGVPGAIRLFANLLALGEK